MTIESHRDGNALGGVLMSLFGVEMTHRRGCCGGCGAINTLGEMHIYVDAPGDVVRCPSCQTVLMVLIRIESVVRINLAQLAWMEMPD